MKTRNYIILLFFPLLIYSFFWLFPSFTVLPFSFFKISPRPGGGGWYDFSYVGTENIVTALTSDSVYYALRNNFIILFAVTFVRNILALFVAVVLFESRIRKAGFFNTMIFLPVAMSPYVLGLLFRFILDPVAGLPVRINPNFTGFLLPDVVPFTVSAIMSWKTFGLPMIIILAGLTSIPKEILESADLDGATGFRRLRYVLVPMLRPVLLILIALSIVSSFQIFDVWVGLYASTELSTVTQVMATLVYHHAFFTNRLGYASALSIILLVIQMAIVLFYFDRIGVLRRGRR